MVKKLFIGLVFCLAFGTSQAQKVGLLTLDQLEKRLEQGRDTVYMVHFWATWCGPCMEELPNFEKLQTQYADTTLKVLMVSVDFKSQLKTRVIPFVKKKKLKTEIYLLNETDQQVYMNRVDKTWSGSIPATLIVYKGQRQFFEKEFTFPELLETYHSLK